MPCISIDKKKKQFLMKYVVDLRWGKYPWQQLESHKEAKRRPRFKVCRYPRRHGKTHYFIHDMRDYLFTVKKDGPVGAYYCPVKDQTMRVAWKTFQKALFPIPGVHMNESAGRIEIARPTLENPNDYITIHFFGIRGGTGEKRGDYYDFVVFDEAEFISPTFIEQVGIMSAFDRDGMVRILGTPAGHGNLLHWIDKAKYFIQLAQTLDDPRAKIKKSIPKKDIMACREWDYRDENCKTLKLFNDKQLAISEAGMSKEAWEMEMLCLDPLLSSGYFHRVQMDEIEKNDQINNFVQMDGRYPLRVYFDLGLGGSSDRMAFLICQFMQSYITVLYGQYVAEKGYIQAAKDLRECPYGGCQFHEIVLPHDANTSEQSDAIPKRDKFETALQDQGIQMKMPVRVMLKSKDKLMDTGSVNILLPKVFFHAIDASEVVHALRHHKRQWDKTHNVFLPKPSKTKVRDMADAFREMSVDYITESYKVVSIDNDRPLYPFDSSKRESDLVSVGGHPTERSIIVGQNTAGGGGGGSSSESLLPTALKWNI